MNERRPEHQDHIQTYRGCGGSRDPLQSPHTHLMGGYQAEGAGPFLGIEEEVLDLRSGSGDILRPRPSWVRRIRKENEKTVPDMDQGSNAVEPNQKRPD